MCLGPCTEASAAAPAARSHRPQLEGRVAEEVAYSNSIDKSKGFQACNPLDLLFVSAIFAPVTYI